jgi:hypothetical protein
MDVSCTHAENVRSPDGGFGLEDDEDFPESVEGHTVPLEIRKTMETAEASLRATPPHRWEPSLHEDTLESPEHDLSHLSKVEQKSVADSVNSFLEFAKRRLVSLVADHLVLGSGRLVDLAFQMYDVVTSVRALASDNPILEAPLPSPVPGVGFSVEIPLSSGEAAPPVAVCISPDSPSLIGGWALDSPKRNKGQEDGRAGGHAPEQPQDDGAEAVLERALEQHAASQRPLKPDEISRRVRQPRSGDRSPIRCVVEIDLESLGLLKHRKLRAWELYLLATEYAALFRKNPNLRRFEVLVITDRQRRCGLWIWLGSGKADWRRLGSAEFQRTPIGL